VVLEGIRRGNGTGLMPYRLRIRRRLLQPIAGFCGHAHFRAPPAYQRLALDAAPTLESSTEESSDFSTGMILLADSEKAEPHRQWMDKGEGE
jgi:hypothetical protein